jgi:hypothetical protein
LVFLVGVDLDFGHRYVACMPHHVESSIRKSDWGLCKMYLNEDRV